MTNDEFLDLGRRLIESGKEIDLNLEMAAVIHYHKQQRRYVEEHQQCESGCQEEDLIVRGGRKLCRRTMEPCPREEG